MRCLYLVLALTLPTLAQNAPLLGLSEPSQARPAISCQMTLSGQLRYQPTGTTRSLEPIRFYQGLSLSPGERNLSSHPYLQPPITYPLGQTGFGMAGNRPGFDPGYGYTSGPFWPVYGNGLGLGIRGDDPELWSW